MCPQVLPGNKVLRGRVISFLHRLVECLGDRLLPYLPSALAALLPVTADAADVGDVSALLSQLAIRYKAALAPLLAKVPLYIHISNPFTDYLHHLLDSPHHIAIQGSRA